MFLKKKTKVFLWFFWVLISIIFLLFVIYKIKLNQPIKVSSFLQEKIAKTDDDNSGLIGAIISGIESVLRNILNSILGRWIKSLLLIPILSFLSAFGIIIFKLTGGNFIQTQVTNGTIDYIGLSIPALFWVVLIISVFIFAIITLINVIVILNSPTHDTAKLKITFKNVIFGSIWFFMLPVFFIVVTMILNMVLFFINNSLASVGTSGSFEYTIGDSIANLGYEKPIVFEGSGTNRYNVLLNSNSYDLLFPTITAIAFLIGFVMMAITIIQQIYQILVLYFLASLSLINFTNDDGQMFKQVFTQFRNKLITNFSIIIGVQLYSYINPMVSAWTSNMTTDIAVQLFLKVSSLIAGLMFMMSFPTFIGSFTGESLNINEGKQGISMITGGVRSAVNPIGSIISKTKGAVANSSSGQARQKVKNDLMQKKVASKAEFMKIKQGKTRSAYQKHTAWENKKFDKMNKI